MRFVVFAFFAVALFVVGWVCLYPSLSDPKNIRYSLWKYGLCKINTDVATTAMIGDRNCEKLVVGKTKKQLENKFDFLLSPENTSPYLRNYYNNSSWKNRTVVFIGKSSWMVVFEGDKAIKLVLVKGY